TNARELAALKTLGERQYYDFHIERNKQAQRVGDISVVLKKTDPKTGVYTIEVLTGESRADKKDKGLNEAVQFYIGKRARMPHEIVVNEVHKDYITGYLSAPKETVRVAAR
ncbi:MAG: hypothetical protein ACRD96_02135, partial [Bryobacteraceae bacterium]